MLIAKQPISTNFFFILNWWEMGVWKCPFPWYLILFLGEEQRTWNTNVCRQCHGETLREAAIPRRTGMLTTFALAVPPDLFINLKTTFEGALQNKSDDDQKKSMLWIHIHKWSRWQPAPENYQEPSLEAKVENDDIISNWPEDLGPSDLWLCRAP